MTITLDNKNFAKSTLAEDLTDVETDADIVDASAFGYPCMAVIWGSGYGSPIQDSTREVVKITNIVSNTLTITRAQESTTNKAWSTGDYIAIVITAGKIDELESEINGKKTDNVSATDMVLGRSSAGAGAIEEIACTSAGRTLIADADAASQRATMELTGFTAKNAIINGALDVWQRGTSFASIANTAFSADRFMYAKNGAVVHDLTQESSDIPTAAEFGGKLNYSMKLQVTTQDDSLAAGDYCFMVHRIEGYNFKGFVGQDLTLSFWVKAYRTGTMCVAFINSGNDRTYVAEVTINDAATWEKKTITVPLDYSGGTWNYINGIGLELRFCLSTGSTYQTTADAWQSGNYIGTSNQTNFTQSTDDFVIFAGFQVERGESASPFEFEHYALTLHKCQRYYETGPTPMFYMADGASGRTAGFFHITFQTNKRASPTMTYSGTWNYYSNAAATSFTPTLVVLSVSSAYFTGTGLTNLNGWQGGSGTWIASAEL